MAGPSSTKPRISGPLRCGQRLLTAYTRSPIRKSAISTAPTVTSFRPRASKSPRRATTVQPSSGDIAPEPDHGLRIGIAVRAILAERVDAVARALEVRLHAREVAPAVLVLVADDPREAALDGRVGGGVVAEDARHD